MKALALLALVACSAPPPKTPASMLAHRLATGATYCSEACPVGEHIDDTVGCCVDPFGLTWSICAWNGTGRYMSPEQLMDPSRLKGDCGGDGYPDCEAP